MVSSISTYTFPLPSQLGYTVWQVNLSTVAARLPKGAGEGKVGVQNLNAVVPIVCHVDFVVASVECNAVWVVKLQRFTTVGTHCCKELASCCELLNAVIQAINH